MAGFGGAVKLTGESEYKRALQQITQSLKEVSSEMTLVSTQYDKNDKSEEALTARTEVLNKKLGEQNKMIGTLTDQYKDYEKAAADQSKQTAELSKSLEDEKKKLADIGKELGTTSQEYKDQEKAVNALAKEVDKATKADDANALAMSKMRQQLNNAQAEANKTAKEIDTLGKETEETGKQAEKSGDGFTVFKGVLANLATQAIDAAISGLKKLGSALVNVGKQALSGFGEFEQLEGGVKKIFGEDLAQEVSSNAEKAFKTAGLSANQYMETVTSFSATLLAGLGDDTSKAVEYADKAIRNMADNANTFGTNIASIQAAYQGFAKDNFTMLDNLKLGYGGSASEMARLINESGVLGDSMEVTAQTVKDVPFYQMVEAIDKTQERLGIMGTTAKEASGTIQGATGSMKAAWQNLLTGIADENANFETLTENFIGTLIDENGGGVIGSILPRISTVITGISNTIAKLLPDLIKEVVPIIQKNLPYIVDAVKTAIKTVLSVLPDILPVIKDLLKEVVQLIVSLAPDLIEGGIDLILALIDGIKEATPVLMDQLPVLIDKIVDTLLNNLAPIIEAGIQLITALAVGILKELPRIVMKIGTEVPKAIFSALVQAVPEMAKAGLELIKGLWEGIKGAGKWLWDKVKGFFGNIVDNIKGFFGIHSPSKLFRDEIGENLALGVGEGFTREMKSVTADMQRAIPTSFDVDAKVSRSASVQGAREYGNMVEAFKQALSEMKIELDDEVAARFIDKTVTRAIFS